MRSLKFKITVFLSLIIGISLLIGCTSTKLSEDFDEEEVTQSAREIISYVNQKDAESLKEMSNVQMRNALTEAALADIFEQVDEFGEFEEIEDISIGGHLEESTEEEFAVAVAKSKYENRNVVYNITFTKQMKLAGLFLK